MPLFRPITEPKRKGQLQEIACPRCRSVLPPRDEESHYGDGVGIRIVEAHYDCNYCGYSIYVKERFPVINKAAELNPVINRAKSWNG